MATATNERRQRQQLQCYEKKEWLDARPGLEELLWGLCRRNWIKKCVFGHFQFEKADFIESRIDTVPYDLATLSRPQKNQ